MNSRFLTLFALLASSTLFVAGCSEDSPFETPPAAGETPLNDGLIAQNNFTILFDPPDPKYVDLKGGGYTSVTSQISVQIGDYKNQLITGAHTIRFRTEWGLIDPSCVTENGTCSVTWRSGSPDSMPVNFRNNILAYTDSGQESFLDIDGNGSFSDGDTFNTVLYADMQEPFINVDESYDSNGAPVFTAGDIIVDTINGIDLTGVNATHDDPDGLYNGPNCSHSTLCSTTRATITVWESGSLILTGSDTFSIGGTITGLVGTVVLLNDGTDDLSVTADGSFVFTTKYRPGWTYNVTVGTQPAGQTCSVTDGSGTVSGDITNISITCI